MMTRTWKSDCRSPPQVLDFDKVRANLLAQSDNYMSPNDTAGIVLNRYQEGGVGGKVCLKLVLKKRPTGLAYIYNRKPRTNHQFSWYHNSVSRSAGHVCTSKCSFIMGPIVLFNW